MPSPARPLPPFPVALFAWLLYHRSLAPIVAESDRTPPPRGEAGPSYQNWSPPLCSPKWPDIKPSCCLPGTGHMSFAFLYSRITASYGRRPLEHGGLAGMQGAGITAQYSSGPIKLQRPLLPPPPAHLSGPSNAPTVASLLAWWALSSASMAAVLYALGAYFVVFAGCASPGGGGRGAPHHWPLYKSPPFSACLGRSRPPF